MSLTAHELAIIRTPPGPNYRDRLEALIARLRGLGIRKRGVLADNRGITGGTVIPDNGRKHWYDATKISGSDGDNVDIWEDQEGIDDLTQTTTDEQPVLKTNQIAGNQVLRFDGENDALQTSFATTVTDRKSTRLNSSHVF
jgi:hypothetical protein